MRRICLWVALVAIPVKLLGQEAQEKGACMRNLNIIYDAVQAYRRERQEMPKNLSELFPKYLSNADLLFCPAARRKGLTSAAFVGNDKLSEAKTSYFYEFNLAPLDEVPSKTNRDWKRTQMGLLGSVVPIVRCLGAHSRVLNLSFDGHIYESELYWEDNFTNVVRREALVNPAELLAPGVLTRYLPIPSRDKAASPRQIDLTEFYNSSLGRSWQSREPKRDLAGLSPGLQELAGIEFDVRGVIQLASSALIKRAEFFSQQVSGIPLNQSCRRLHFLLGSCLEADDGLEAARAVVQLQNGPPIILPLRMGADFRCSWSNVSSPTPSSHSAVAWTGTSPGANPGSAMARLFLCTWENPQPGSVLKSLDLTSSLTDADVFIAAITVEP